MTRITGLHVVTYILLSNKADVDMNAVDRGNEGIRNQFQTGFSCVPTCVKYMLNTITCDFAVI